MRITNTPFDSSFEEKANVKQQKRDSIRQRGSEKRPDPPRSIVSTAGSRCAQVAWSAPPIAKDVAGYRIYVDTENTPYGVITDPSVRTYEVSCSTGVTPQPRNVFISSVNAAGFESRRVQIQVVCLPEIYQVPTPATTGGTQAPPPTPPPPPTSSTEAESPDDNGFQRYV